MPNESYRPRVSFVDVSPDTIATFNRYIPSGERMRVLGAAMEMLAQHIRNAPEPHEVIARLIVQTMQYSELDYVLVHRDTLKAIKAYLESHYSEDPAHQLILQKLAKECR